MNAFKTTIIVMAVATAGIFTYATIADGQARAEKAEAAAPAGTFDSSSLLVNSQPEPTSNHFATIEAGAINFDVTEMPGLNAKLGTEEVARLRDGLSAAAFRTAKAPACDTVTYVSISENSERGNASFFANCKNGVQYHFTETELKDKDGNWFDVTTAIEASKSWDSAK